MTWQECYWPSPGRLMTWQRAIGLGPGAQEWVQAGQCLLDPVEFAHSIVPNGTFSMMELLVWLLHPWDEAVQVDPRLTPS